MSRPCWNSLIFEILYVDASPTWRTFNYTAYSVREMVHESLAWDVQMGWLKDKVKGENAWQTTAKRLVS